MYSPLPFLFVVTDSSPFPSITKSIVKFLVDFSSVATNLTCLTTCGFSRDKVVSPFTSPNTNQSIPLIVYSTFPLTLLLTFIDVTYLYSGSSRPILSPTFKVTFSLATTELTSFLPTTLLLYSKLPSTLVLIPLTVFLFTINSLTYTWFSWSSVATYLIYLALSFKSPTNTSLKSLFSNTVFHSTPSTEIWTFPFIIAVSWEVLPINI